MPTQGFSPRRARGAAAKSPPDAKRPGPRLQDLTLAPPRARPRLRSMAGASRGLGRPDAAERVLDLLLLAAGRKSMAPAPGPPGESAGGQRTPRVGAPTIPR